MTAPWFVEAFRGAYLDVYPHRDLEAAREEVRYLAARGVAGLVLDLCCGFGRHCLALRELGITAFGLDLSPELLGRARELSSELAGKLVCGDARALPLRSGRLDAAVSLFSSFGYFGEAGDRTLLDEVGRVLRSGGWFVLDLMNPEFVRTRIVPVSSSKRGSVEIEERRSLVEGGRRVQKDVSFRACDGQTTTWREDVRLYSVSDLEPWLAGAGIELQTVHGNFDASAHSAASPRQILWGRRR